MFEFRFLSRRNSTTATGKRHCIFMENSGAQSSFDLLKYEIIQPIVAIEIDQMPKCGNRFFIWEKILEINDCIK